MRTIAVDSGTDALLIVDVQNDFCPGGTLAVPYGDTVVPVINRFLQQRWLSVATMDWHPPEHCSFTSHGGPWPPHCVQDTAGAELHPELEAHKIQLVIRKGSDPHQDAYSGFQGTKLAEILRDKGIDRVVICGIATDYCVRATAHDALQEGFKVLIVEDAIRGVEVHAGDCQRAIEELRQAGAQMIISSDLRFD